MYYFLLNPDSILGHIILSGLTRGVCIWNSLSSEIVEEIKFKQRKHLFKGD